MTKKIYDKTAKIDISKLVLQELQENPFYKFKLVFALLSVIPLLTFFYIFIVNGLDITKISFILYVLIFISFSGFMLGYSIIKKLFDKTISYTIELKQSEQLKSELVASVSHDFKTPIIIVKELLALLVDGSIGAINDKQRKNLNSCCSTLENMSHTLETLLDLYKIEAGMIALRKEPCDLVALLAEKIAEFQVLFEKNKITLVNKISEKNYC